MVRSKEVPSESRNSEELTVGLGAGGNRILAGGMAENSR